MIANAYRYYAGSFSGFNRQIWLLTFASFVNRAGTMVVPFLSLYLTKDMGLTLEEVGWIMSCFGAGSVVGSWLGGRLSDRIGYKAVMVGALVTSGLAFIGLQYVRGFLHFGLAVFVLMVLSDAFRPAMFVAIRSYAPPASAPGLSRSSASPSTWASASARRSAASSSPTVASAASSGWTPSPASVLRSSCGPACRVRKEGPMAPPRTAGRPRRPTATGPTSSSCSSWPL